MPAGRALRITAGERTDDERRPRAAAADRAAAARGCDVTGPPKGVEEARRLAKLRHEYETARAAFIESNMGLVFLISRRFYPIGINGRDDIVQDGMIGLCRAADRFDPERGFQFSTYARWWIEQSIRDGLHETARTVRIPRDKSKVAGLGSERMVSVDAMDSEARDLFFIAMEKQTRYVEMGEAGVQVAAYMARLPVRQRMAVNLRLGIGGQAPLCLREVGEEMGISRERVRQLVQIAVTTMARLATIGKRGIAKP